MNIANFLNKVKKLKAKRDNQRRAIFQCPICKANMRARVLLETIEEGEVRNYHHKCRRCKIDLEIVIPYNCRNDLIIFPEVNISIDGKDHFPKVETTKGVKNL